MDQAALAAALTEVSGNLVLTSTALTEHSTELTTVGATLTKATDEIVLALTNGGVTSPEVDTAVASLRAAAASLVTQSNDLKTKGTALKTAADGLDGLNPDLTPSA